MPNIYDIHRETRDNLGSQDENKNIILIGPFTEKIGVEEGPTILKKRDVGTAFIWGHTDNGIWGTSAWGGGTIEAFSIQRVVNPNNTFHEHFRFSDLNDTTNTTGSFSTTNFNVSMDYNEIYQTLEVFKNLESVQYATVYVDFTGTKTQILIDSSGGQIVTITEGT